MRIGEITNSAEYQIDEQNQNLPIFGIKLWFSKFQKFQKFSLLRNSKKIIKFLKLLSFKNQEIFKIWQFVKLDFRYFNIGSFEFSKYQPFYIWLFQILTPTNAYNARLHLNILDLVFGLSNKNQREFQIRMFFSYRCFRKVTMVLEGYWKEQKKTLRQGLTTPALCGNEKSSCDYRWGCRWSVV